MRILKAAIKSRKPQGSQNSSSAKRNPSTFALKVSAHDFVSEKRPAVAMIPHNSNHSLPLSPTGSHPRSLPSAGNFAHFQRPSLATILADEAPEPWTLAAFTEYCQQNLCIENLNFIMEAKEYRDHYEEWISRCTVPPSPDDVARSERLVDLWHNILSQYIIPLGPQEVNISGEVRESITSIPETDVPPDPDSLQPAVQKIQELMQDSILFSFINDVRAEAHNDDFRGHQNSPHHVGASDAWQRARSIQFSGSPTASSGFAYPQSNSSLYHKHSTASTTSSRHHPSTSSYHSSRPKSVLSSKEPLEASISASASTPSGDEMEDVMSSPRALSDGRASPRLSPMRSIGSHVRRSSPKSRGSESGWKKIGAIMGLKRNRDDTPP